MRQSRCHYRSHEIPGVYLLDREMDPITTAASLPWSAHGDAIQESRHFAASGGRRVDRPSPSIRAAHPRMGAADVIPLFRSTASPSKTASPWHPRGSEIAKRFQIPSISMKPPRPRPNARTWNNIRRGQFKASAPTSRPIRAQARFRRASRASYGRGATVVGARKALVAYNVFLNTPDVDIAKKIAKADALFQRRAALR